MDEQEIEQAARAFLERASGDHRFVDPEAFEALVQREVALTLRQRRAIERASRQRATPRQPAPAEGR